MKEYKDTKLYITKKGLRIVYPSNMYITNNRVKKIEEFAEFTVKTFKVPIHKVFISAMVDNTNVLNWVSFVFDKPAQGVNKW